jgi:hypothetical protein
MIAIQYQVIYTNNYKNYILNDLKITTHMCSQCRQKLETIQHKSSACNVVAPGDYTHHHNQVATIAHQELSIKSGQSKGPPMPCYKYELQSALDNSKLYTILRQDHNNWSNYP